MILYYICLLFLLFGGAKLHVKGINAAYLSKGSTNVIKGLFIALIFMSHIQEYIRKSGYLYDTFGDGIVLGIQSTLGQLVVVMFLFYSGYGVMEQYKLKGHAYVCSMPKRRMLTTLVNFDIAVLVFILADLLLDKPITIGQCMSSLLAWESVGNSNWYIFTIVLCYVNAYVGFLLISRYDKLKIGGGYFSFSDISFLCFFIGNKIKRMVVLQHYLLFLGWNRIFHVQADNREDRDRTLCLVLIDNHHFVSSYLSVSKIYAWLER